MRIVVNNKEIEISDRMTLLELMTEIGHTQSGIAVAVNQQVISRIRWEQYALSPNDQIIVIKATCGG